MSWGNNRLELSEDLILGAIEPASVRMAKYLYDAEMTTPEALATVAELWRAFPVESDTQRTTIFALSEKTLQLLEDREELGEQPSIAFCLLHNIVFEVKQW